MQEKPREDQNWKDGRVITGSSEKEGDYPDFFDQVLRIQVRSQLTVQSRKRRTTTSTCEEASVKQTHHDARQKRNQKEMS